MGSLVLLLLLLSEHLRSTMSSLESWQWVDSVNVSKWYSPLDLCLLNNDTAANMDDVLQHCRHQLDQHQIPYDKQQPIRCIAGNSWPSKSGFCSADDIVYTQRYNFKRTIVGHDDPTRRPLTNFFSKLGESNGSFLLVGDSVMQQFVSAIACELERENVWQDPSQFTNTDEVKYVTVNDNDAPVPMKFLPIYHFVNGRYDRVANYSMLQLQRNVEEYVNKYNTLVVIINMGLHYVSNPVPHFSKEDYIQQMTTALMYLHSVSIRFLATNKKIKIIWRETSAQHFPTPGGYWPGVRYASDMKLACVPIKAEDIPHDWRNIEIRNIIQNHRLTSIEIMPFYHATLPLWNQHVNGYKQDCTHFCWTPYLYQTCFRYMENLDL